MRFTFAAVALLFCQMLWPADDSSRRLTLGTVTDDIRPEVGRCSLQLPHDYSNREGRYVFVGDFQNHGLLNVDGTDTHVELVKSEGVDVKKRPQVGEKARYSYAGGGLDVEVDYVATGGCARGDESCLVSYYDATLTVKRGKAHKTVAAKGVCGG